MPCTWAAPHHTLPDSLDSSSCVDCLGGAPTRISSGDGTRHTESFTDTCLIRCFQNYGLPIRPPRSGPFWTLCDGNEMLQPWQHAVIPVPRQSLLVDGRYVVHRDCHFFNVWVQAGGAACLQMDGDQHCFLSLSQRATYVCDPSISVFAGVHSQM